MNDYELVFLVKTQNDSIAFDFLFQKYQKFIWKHIHLLRIDYMEQDDFFQEGVLMLYKAVQTFDEAKQKTFTRYFELILRRQFYQLIYKLPKYLLYEDSNFMSCFSTMDKEDDLDLVVTCSRFEKEIYQFYFIEKQAVDKISEKLSCDPKKIYNAIFRIKEKYKNMI